jgi:uncharacterized protein DUF2442
MSTADHEWPAIRSVEVDDQWIMATFADGRRVGLPLSWSWRLEQASRAQRAHWELMSDGVGIHWPDIDEDLSARGFFIGSPAPRPRAKSSENSGERGVLRGKGKGESGKGLDG